MIAMSRDLLAVRANVAEEVATRLAALGEMDYAALQHEWRRLYRQHPPRRVFRDFLVLGVAWKIQEKAYGGLGAATKRQLDNLAQAMEQDGDIARNRVAHLKPGAKLLREWQGKTQTVIVLEDGFEWEGKRWRSLSAIARTITGAHWSGPRFFGVKDPRFLGETKRPAAGVRTVTGLTEDA